MPPDEIGLDSTPTSALPFSDCDIPVDRPPGTPKRQTGAKSKKEAREEVGPLCRQAFIDSRESYL